MRLSKITLALAIGATFLVGCTKQQGETAKKYVLTFYQEHGNHFDDYDVTVGKTTYEEIQTFASSLRDFTKVGYDRSWDWDHYDFENQETDWTIDALYSKHNYKISFQYQNVEIAYTTYQIGDTSYTIPQMTPEDKGYKYVFEAPSIVGKHEDIIVPMTVERLAFELKFYLDDSDQNPTIVNYTFNNPVVTAPTAGTEGYDCVWKTKDSTISLLPGVPVNMLETYGESKLDNYSLYLNKTPKTFTVKFNVNGGSMDAETTTTILYGSTVNFPVPTFKNSASFLGWYDLETGELVENGQPYSIARDINLIARYVLTFEDDASKDLLIKGSRNTIASKDLDSSTQTLGSKSLKITTTASATFSCGFDADFITSAFADPNVVAIDFDAKGSVKASKLSQQNNVTSAYERKNLDDSTDFGLDTIWKTFELTREQYNSLSAKNDVIWTVGNQMPEGSFFWIDNVRPVTENLDYFGFENSRLVSYQPESPWYNRTVSFRNFDNKEIFQIAQNENAKNTYFGYDYSVKSEGNRSIKYHRDTNCWCNLIVFRQYYDWESITFDVCLSIDYNGNTLRCGNGSELFSTSKVIKANTWATFTINRNQASTDGNAFATFSGSPIFDFWIDNLQITLAEAE